MIITEQEIPFQADNQLRFISLGSGSSGNCYLLFTDNEALVVDIGIGSRILKKHFRQYGLKLPDHTSILVTHDHADHVKNVGTISNDKHFKVYTTQLVHRGIDRNYSIRHKVNEELRCYVETDKTYEIGSFQVTPFSVPHDSSDCVGYKIMYNGIVFSIITDVGHVTDRIKQIISESNYLVIEANHDEEMLHSGPYSSMLKARVAGPTGHLSNKNCGLALAENATPELRHVWLCHLSEENNHPELARKTIETILRDRGIVVGADFLLDVLKRKVPSEIYPID